MASILDGKTILAVDDEPDVLATLEEEIQQACSGCTVDKATTYEEGSALLAEKTYDVVVLDIMGVRGFDLLEIATGKHLKTAMLTANALSPEALKKSHDLGAMAYLPKDALGEVVPFLEDMLRYDHKEGRHRILEKLDDYFASRFEAGWKDRSGLKD